MTAKEPFGEAIDAIVKISEESYSSRWIAAFAEGLREEEIEE